MCSHGKHSLYRCVRNHEPRLPKLLQIFQHLTTTSAEIDRTIFMYQLWSHSILSPGRTVFMYQRWWCWNNNFRLWSHSNQSSPSKIIPPVQHCSHKCHKPHKCYNSAIHYVKLLEHGRLDCRAKQQNKWKEWKNEHQLKLRWKLQIHEAVKRYSSVMKKWSWSLSLRLVYPVLHKPPGATITSRSAVRIRINFWRMAGALYLLWRLSQCTWGLRPWDWSYPVLQYLQEWPTPGVTHSVFVTGTVVKPQQPTNHRRWN